MARVTSEKTRQYRFVVDDAMEDGIPVDNIALFLPDGTPIDLTADPTKMKWVGPWSALSGYFLNDVVLNNNGLYILIVDSIPAGESAPSTPNVHWQLVFVAPPGGGFKGSYSSAVSYPVGSIVLYNGALWGAPTDIPSGGNPPNELPDAIAVTLAIAGFHNIGRYIPGSQWTGLGTTATDDATYRYFDLATGGDVNFPSNGVGNQHAGWNGAGTFIWTNFSGSKPGLAAGRYIVSASNLAGPLALSNGATFQSNYPPNWTLLKKIELPAGGAIDDVLVRTATPDYKVGWQTRPIPVRDTRANRISVGSPTLGRLWKETDTGLVYIGDGSIWQIFNANGLIRLANDFTLPQSDTTISGSGDVVMSFPTESNGVYLVEGLLRLQGVSQLADIKVDFGYSGTYEMLRELDALGVVAASAPVLVSTGTPLEYGLDNGITFARFTAILTGPAFSATASFRAAQVTSQAENVKVLKNSVLKLQRLV